MNAFMKVAVVVILLGAASVDPALAQPPKPAAESVADTIKRLEEDWTDAMIVVDLARVGKYLADDWIGGAPAKAMTKQGFIDSVKSGKHKLESCELGPRDVQVLSNDVAVLQGSATETRLADGQRTTFRVTYMDVWVKRGDRWVVFRSHASKL